MVLSDILITSSDTHKIRYGAEEKGISGPAWRDGPTLQMQSLPGFHAEWQRGSG